MMIDISKEEIEDLIRELDLCISEGYLASGSPAYDFYQRLLNLR